MTISKLAFPTSSTKPFLFHNYYYDDASSVKLLTVQERWRFESITTQLGKKMSHTNPASQRNGSRRSPLGTIREQVAGLPWALLHTRVVRHQVAQVMPAHGTMRGSSAHTCPRFTWAPRVLGVNISITGSNSATRLHGWYPDHSS